MIFIRVLCHALPKMNNSRQAFLGFATGTVMIQITGEEVVLQSVLTCVACFTTVIVARE